MNDSIPDCGPFFVHPQGCLDPFPSSLKLKIKWKTPRQSKLCTDGDVEVITLPFNLEGLLFEQVFRTRDDGQRRRKRDFLFNNFELKKSAKISYGASHVIHTNTSQDALNYETTEEMRIDLSKLEKERITGVFILVSPVNGEASACSSLEMFLYSNDSLDKIWKLEIETQKMQERLSRKTRGANICGYSRKKDRSVLELAESWTCFSSFSFGMLFWLDPSDTEKYGMRNGTWVFQPLTKSLGGKAWRESCPLFEGLIGQRSQLINGRMSKHLSAYWEDEVCRFLHVVRDLKGESNDGLEVLRVLHQRMATHCPNFQDHPGFQNLESAIQEWHSPPNTCGWELRPAAFHYAGGQRLEVYKDGLQWTQEVESLMIDKRPAAPVLDSFLCPSICSDRLDQYAQGGVYTCLATCCLKGAPEVRLATSYYFPAKIIDLQPLTLEMRGTFYVKVPDMGVDIAEIQVGDSACTLVDQRLHEGSLVAKAELPDKLDSQDTELAVCLSWVNGNLAESDHLRLTLVESQHLDTRIHGSLTKIVDNVCERTKRGDEGLVFTGMPLAWEGDTLSWSIEILALDELKPLRIFAAGFCFNKPKSLKELPDTGAGLVNKLIFGYDLPHIHDGDTQTRVDDFRPIRSLRIGDTLTYRLESSNSAFYFSLLHNGEPKVVRHSTHLRETHEIYGVIDLVGLITSVKLLGKPRPASELASLFLETE